MTMRAPLAHCMVNWDDRAKEFCELFEIYRLFPNMTLCPSTYLPAGDPDAFLNTMNGGQFVRPSADTVSDVFGNIVSLENNQIAYCGGLIVENLSLGPVLADYTVYTTAGGTATDNGGGSWTFSSPGGGGRAFIQLQGVAVSGEYYLVAFELESLTGTPGNYNVYLYAGAQTGQKLFEASAAGNRVVSDLMESNGSDEFRVGVGCTAALSAAHSITISNLIVYKVTNWPTYAQELIPAHVSVGVGDGDELVPSTTFEDWADSTVPDGWTKGHTPDANNYVEENANGMRVVSDGTWVSVALDENVIEGQTYAYSITVNNTTGDITFINTDGATIVRPTSSGTSTGTFVAVGTGTIDIKRTGACDVVVNELTVQRVPSNANYDGVQYLTQFPSQGVNADGEVFDFDSDGLGPELHPSPEFTTWSSDDPDGWSVTETVNAYVTEDANGANFVSTDGSIITDFSLPVLTSGNTYLLEIETESSTGRIKIGTSGSANEITAKHEDSVTEYVFQSDSSQLVIQRWSGVTDVVIKRLSVKRYNPHAGHGFSDGYGANLVLNGSNLTDTNHWTEVNTATISAVSGALRVVSAAGYDQARQDLYNLVVGNSYEMEVTIPASTSNTYFGVVNANTYSTPANTARTETMTFTATNADETVALINVGTETVDYSEIKLREVIETPGYCYRAAGTNLITESEDFSSSPWFSIGTATVTAGFVDPSGGSNGHLIEDVDDVGVDSLYIVLSGLTVSVRHEPSFYIKQVSTTGTLVMASAAGGPGQGNWEIDLSALSGEWERITRDHAAVTVVTEYNSTAGGNSGVNFYSSAADGDLDFYLFGVQLEESESSSPYIATSGGPATRDAPTTFSLDDSLWPDAAGAMIFEFIPEYDSDHPDNHGLVVIRNNEFSLCYDVNAVGTLRSYDGTNTATANGLTWSAGELVKYLLRWSDDFGVYALCEDTSTDTDDDKTFAGTFLPDGNGIRFGYSSTVSFKIKRFAIFSVDPKLDRLKELAE